MRDAIDVIDRSGLKVVMVVDSDRTLLGLVTDGDIRRALLRGHDLTTSLETIMTRHPKTAPAGTSKTALLSRLRHEQILHLPLVDGENRVIDLAYLPEIESLPSFPNSVVIMAGGLGQRLRPITETIPKPMVEVGGRPLLHTTVEMLVSQGFNNITMSLNYLGEIIRDYFEDGKKFGANIHYVQEKDRLGTAGALSLLEEKPEFPFFVMNGDILTSIDFGAMLDFHVKSGSVATMAVNKYSYNVPYGVINVGNDRILSIKEKPTYDLFVNAGIYVIDPSVIAQIPQDQYFDMPTLFDKLIGAGGLTSPFPIREQWIDIGQVADLARANREYGAIVQSTPAARSRPQAQDDAAH